MCIKNCDDIKIRNSKVGDIGNEGGKNNVIHASSSEYFQLQLQLQSKLNKQRQKGSKLPNFRIIMCCCYLIIMVLII
ncbi:hypothetical protein KR054_010706 [Drosophila jambulina]|nr:hypothetical protein KR054_010706 [Drosophila jambulina]